MQVKVVIGTISFMLVMIIMGVAALLEPARLQQTTEAFAGRQIENGAALFQNNCQTCHGVEGKAEQCFDAAGNQIGCAGLPLNYAPFICGEPSERMVQMGWDGSKQNFIFQTISAGRMGTSMPTWSQDFGGPMEPYQIDQLTAYILNWDHPDLCGDETAVEAVEWPDAVEDLPEGNPEVGEGLYEIPYACVSCHGDPAGDPSTAVIGPHLGDIANVAETRVEGQSAAQYIYESILDPNAFIAPDCPNGPCLEPSVMQASNFGDRMTEQDMADLIAYYLTLTGDS